jgi:Ca-activated chloride channel family protein
MSANSEHDRDLSGVPGDLDLTALALGQLDDVERAEVERKLAAADGEASKIVAQTRRLANEVRAVLTADNPAPSKDLHETLTHRMGNAADDDVRPSPASKPQSYWRRHATVLIAASLVVALLAAVILPPIFSARSNARVAQSGNDLKQAPAATSWEESTTELRYQRSYGESVADRYNVAPMAARSDQPQMIQELTEASRTSPSREYYKGPEGASGLASSSAAAGASADPSFYNSAAGVPAAADVSSSGTTPYFDRGLGGYQGGPPATTSPSAQYSGGQASGKSDKGWNYRVPINGQQGGVQAGRRIGGGQVSGDQPVGDLIAGSPAGAIPGGAGYQGGGPGTAGGPPAQTYGGTAGPGMGALGSGGVGGGMRGMMPGIMPGTMPDPAANFSFFAEQYAPIAENGFITVQGYDALSTFSIDVDTASYANARRFLTQGRLPPADAVRIEEMVNYFHYDYPQPQSGEPFSVNMEMAECPWQQKHLLLRVGLKGREIQQKERPVSNLVFLLDVSGSMADQNKLPLLKQVLSMMVRELREDDRVSIVTYAGEAGLRLPPTTGNDQPRILAAIDSLSAGGSTNGSAGIELAYEQAKGYFRPEGTNRVILATDGDLNVGITDDESLVRLIKDKATGGTFLTVLGFGEGNLKDAKMERLADNGNGLYAYIDSVREGHKVLVEQMSASLVTIAKDVKVQIEFNPAHIQSYRLLGYENRMLTAPEFNDDKRDAGEIGAGHTVTALYELVPAGTPLVANEPETTLRYQAGEGVQGSGIRVQEGKLTEAAASGELLTLKLRHKEPDGEVSKFSQYPLKNRGSKFNAASKDFQFAAAVASFGMQLRNSPFRGDGNLAAVVEIAAGATGEDKGGYRAEFVDLVRKAQALGVK